MTLIVIKISIILLKYFEATILIKIFYSWRRCAHHMLSLFCKGDISFILNYIFKYHVSCTDGKISVRINLLFCLFFHRCPIQQLCVSFLRPFVVNTTFSTGIVGVQVSSVSWFGQLTVGV